MKVSPWIISGALLFWGSETDNLLVGGLLALLCAASALTARRYTLTDEDFIKISDVTSLVFLAAVALVLINFKPINFLRITASWLPLILSPLILAQLYSTSDTIVIGTRLGKKKAVHAHKPLDFRFYYFFVCLFAAATGNSRSLAFYPGLALILSCFFYQNRGRSFSPVLFFLLCSFALGLGYAANTGMELAHRRIVEKMHGFWRGYYHEKYSDPFKAHVNFGALGRLKMSGEILMRVESASGPPPLLFKEANYAVFAGGNWLGGSQESFQFLPPAGEFHWNLIAPPHKDGQRLEVEYRLPREKGLLPFPQGGYRLESKTIFEIEKNNNTVIKVIDGAEVISYTLWQHAEMRDDIDLPSGRNLVIPENERYALQAVTQQLALGDLSASEKVAALEGYLRNGFQYSLNFLGKEGFDTPLGNFLLNRKSGFCEYYATAGALLLRYWGIPSRYVVGYAVVEKSRLEGKYIVRKRHAHAWVEAFIGGQWIAIDNTPSTWVQNDQQQASVFEGLYDIWQFVQHWYRLFRIGSGTENTLVFSIIIVVLTTFLVLRIYRRMKIEQAKREREADNLRTFERIISPLTPVIDFLFEADLERGEKETFAAWAGRIYPWRNFDTQLFQELYHLHLRMRYDPQGLTAEEKEGLRFGAEVFLVEMRGLQKAS